MKAIAWLKPDVPTLGRQLARKHNSISGVVRLASLIPRTLMLVLLATTLVVPADAHAQTAGTLMAYTTVPAATASSSYTLKVNGTPVFVEKIGDVSVARFAFTGRAALQVTATAAAIANPILSPRSYGILPQVSGQTMSFSIDQPRKLILRIDGTEKLLLFADGPERNPRQPGQAGVVNLADYLVATRDPAVPVTAEMQRAIDATSVGNGGAGGVLYVPAGLYMSAQLRLKTNVELYLDSGARVRAVPVFNSTNYPVQNGADSSFIYITDASNVKIAGRGVIDGNGWNLRTNTPGGGNCKLLRTRNSHGVILEDVYFRDSARWSLHVLYSDDVYVRNVKLVNDMRIASGGTLPFVSNTDGFDIDASTFVTVEDSFVYTTDDAFTPKVTGYMGLTRPASNLFIRNNVIWTEKAALKVGNETLKDISEVNFDNNDIVQADRFIALWNDGGSTIHHVRARYNRTETIGVRDNKNFFYFYIRTMAGYVRDIEVNGLQALTRAPNESRLEGWDAAHPVSNFVVKNMYVAGLPMTTVANIPLVNRNAFVTNVNVAAPGADGPPTVSVVSPDDFGIEGSDTGVFTFERAGSLDVPLTVPYALSGTATAGVDYTVPASSVTFPAGAHQVSAVVTPRADSIAEGDETVLLTLASSTDFLLGYASNASIGIGNVAPPPPVVDPPSTAVSVSVVVEDGSASESQSPVNAGRFRVSRTGALDAPLTVALSWAGTATNGVDYASMPGSVTIPAGSDRVKLVVTPFADSRVEPNEKVTLAVQPSGAYSLATGPGTLTILNVGP